MKSSQHKRNLKLQFDAKTRMIILERDRRCIFCERNYHMAAGDLYAYKILDVMHYINKSAGGLGIKENGVLGCRYHHQLLDNGNKGLRPEMLGIMREHLKMFYKDWNEKNLYYDKYDW